MLGNNQFKVKRIDLVGDPLTGPSNFFLACQQLVASRFDP
jgi:hypothetical protein